MSSLANIEKTAVRSSKFMDYEKDERVIITKRTLSECPSQASIYGLPSSPADPVKWAEISTERAAGG